MKLLRSKSIGVQIKALALVLTRTRKIHAEFRELALRNWTGGEMEIAKQTRDVRDELDTVITHLKEAEKLMKELEKAAIRKGK